MKKIEPLLIKNIEQIGKRVLNDLDSLSQTGIQTTFKDKDELFKNDWLSACVMLNHFFFRGRKDELSNSYYNHTVIVIEEELGLSKNSTYLEKISSINPVGLYQRLYNYINNDSQTSYNVLNKDSITVFKNEFRNNNLIMALIEPHPKDQSGKSIPINNDLDLLMVINVLSYLVEGKISNAAVYANERILSGEIKILFDELNNINGVGNKLTSFYLRNMVAVLKIPSALLMGNYKYVLPIDTWILKALINICGKEIIKEKQYLYNPDPIKEIMIKICEENNIDPIAFNQGCWYVGFNSYDLLLGIMKKQPIEFEL